MMEYIFCRGRSISRFAQAIWGDSLDIGCAISYYKRMDINTYQMICCYTEKVDLHDKMYDVDRRKLHQSRSYIKGMSHSLTNVEKKAYGLRDDVDAFHFVVEITTKAPQYLTGEPMSKEKYIEHVRNQRIADRKKGRKYFLAY